MECWGDLQQEDEDTEDIDIACVQEPHLNPNHRFIVRGYQTFRMDREGRHEGGIPTLVRNYFPATDFQVDTNHQAEIQEVKVKVDGSDITIFNLYCPPDKELSLCNSSIYHQRTALLLEILTVTHHPGDRLKLN